MVFKYVLGIELINGWPRLVFLCPDEYKNLAVKNENIGFCERLHHNIYSSISMANKNLMVMPFKSGDKSFSKYNFDQLVQWVYENRKDPENTKSEISESYDKYINYIQSIF